MLRDLTGMYLFALPSYWGIQSEYIGKTMHDYSQKHATSSLKEAWLDGNIGNRNQVASDRITRYLFRVFKLNNPNFNRQLLPCF